MGWVWAGLWQTDLAHLHLDVQGRPASPDDLAHHFEVLVQGKSLKQLYGIHRCRHQDWQGRSWSSVAAYAERQCDLLLWAGKTSATLNILASSGHRS